VEREGCASQRRGGSRYKRVFVGFKISLYNQDTKTMGGREIDEGKQKVGRCRSRLRRGLVTATVSWVSDHEARAKSPVVFCRAFHLIAAPEYGSLMVVL